MATTTDYENALRELEHLHDSGRIDNVRYELHKSKLLAEASNPHAGDLQRVVRTVLIIVTILIAVPLVFSVVAALG